MVASVELLENAIKFLLPISEFPTLKKYYKSDILSAIDILQEVQRNLKKKNEKLAEKSSSENYKVSDKVNNSYAAVVKKKISQTRTSHKLLVENKSGEKNIENTRNNFKKVINPKELKIGIRNIKSTRNGDLVIECDSKNDIDKIHKKLEDTDCALKSKPIKKLRPSLIIKNIPEEITINNLVETLITQNEELNLEENEISAVFIMTTKNKIRRSAIINVSPRARNILLSSKLKLYYSMCYSEDFISPRRCTKCSKLNHSKGSCREALTCPHCSGGHTAQDCPVKEKIEEHKCVNCISYNNYCKAESKVSISHSALSKSCPSYRNALNRLILNTEYNNN